MAYMRKRIPKGTKTSKRQLTSKSSSPDLMNVTATPRVTGNKTATPRVTGNKTEYIAKLKK